MVRKAWRRDSLERAAGLACVIGAGAIGAACGSIDTSVFRGESGGAGGSSSSSSSAGGASSTSSSSSSTSTSTSTSTSSTSTSSSTSSASSSGPPPATCGDGKRDPGEECDGADLGGQSCADAGFSNPAGLGCTPQCTLDASGCKPTCNGAKVEPGEVCDGTNLNGHTCTEFGYANPAGLKCSSTCTLEQGGCKAVCGNGKVEPTEDCDDGNTTNGDGCSSTCKFESTQGTTCNNAIPLTVGLGTMAVLGSTKNGGAHYGSQCSGSDGPDRVYAITVQNSGFLTVSLARTLPAKQPPLVGFDSVLYVAQGCQEGGDTTSLLCADSYDDANNVALDGGEVVSLRVQQGQKYYVFVDGFASSDVGDYQMTVDLSTGTDCNDPVPIPLEPGTAMTVLGNNNNTLPTAQGSCGGGPGGQIVYRIVRPDNGPITVDTDPSYTTFNSVLYARSGCGDANSQLACSNQQGTAMESIDLANVQAGVPVFVYVDGSTSGGGNAFGPYGLTLTP
jgi:cysteine-rich repeat protein